MTEFEGGRGVDKAARSRAARRGEHTEREASSFAGGPMLAILLLAIALIGYAFSVAAKPPGEPILIGVFALVEVALLVCLGGFFVVNPNQAKVLQLFGSYVGTERTAGLRWANPFYSKRTVSLRAASLESARLKVNDLEGNPIEIAAIIVWRVVDTAAACFQVDDHRAYVSIQSESALRHMATSYPYDAHDAGKPSLRGSTDEVAALLERELAERVSLAGVEIVEARISHLAYAPEIAQAMLQRQQASAIIAARQKIVDGAVGMVEMALARLAEKEVVALDEERKAAMVSNLLVVLCSERAASPVVNTGTLYT
ncbi:MAG TPA: SPFH domain-containing protein [Polyangiaceae bacterium]|jgi:regulator of protease activity HflC (stomatin/prohibitin superfamily)|nr:SPFH domain-containing protein [Polyangiaceae bacterium]